MIDAFAGELLKIDRSRDHGVPQADRGTSGVAFTEGGVWVSIAPDGLARVDPADLGVTFPHQNVGSGPTAVLPAFGKIWVANHLDDTVSRVEPSTGQEEVKIPVGTARTPSGSPPAPLGRERVRRSITEIDPTTRSSSPSRSVGRWGRSRPAATTCGSPWAPPPPSISAGP